MTRSFILGLLALTPAAVLAEDFKVPHIEVWGVAERDVVPDLMNWSLEVRTEGLDVEKVASRHQKAATSTLDFLKENGIEKEEMQTTRMQLQELWEWRDGARYRKGYFATTSINFETGDFETYNDLWTGLSRLEDVTVQNVSLAIDDRRSVVNEVQVDALRAARQKAQALAAALGGEVGEPLLISEESSDPVFPQQRMMAMEARAQDSAAISPGVITVEARIRAVFRLLNE